MKKTLSKFFTVFLAIIITLSSAPVNSLLNIDLFSPVTVVAQAASKTHLNAAKKSIYVGRKYTLKLIGKSGKTVSPTKVKWSSADKSIATVSTKGIVTGKKIGKVKITAQYKGTKYSSVITVKSAVSVSKTKLTFDRGATAKQTIKVTCKDDKGIRCRVVKGSGIVKTAQSSKWTNDTKSFYITPTGKKFGEVKLKIYSVENSNSYAYVYVNVKAPYVLKTKNELPCAIYNYNSKADYKAGEKARALKIHKVTYETPDVKTLDITVVYEARKSSKSSDNYYFNYSVLNKSGNVVKSGLIKSKTMSVGDKAKVKITLTGLKSGGYTIKFSNYIKPTSDSEDTVNDPLAMYQNAAKEINKKGVAGYSKKSWQSFENLQFSGSAALQAPMQSILEGFMTTEDEAEVKVSKKGSDDAKMRMPISNCSSGTVKSVTAKESGSNIVITIVMRDQINPAATDTDGITVMSKDILFMEDVKNVVDTDPTVGSVVKSLNKAEIKYEDYTIVATMTKDGKFVKIKHYCASDITTDMTTFSGDMGIRGNLIFNTEYSDFVY